MSESEVGEQAARSLALEQAYVHEVYEQCADKSVQAKHWPRVNQFLDELEPGALVCDIGCGNGKYLDVNRNVFSIGVDRCSRFTSMARDNGNEVMTCDNLSLPFRDESFDAVLSIAVVHHFSTTERRVRALKELARVLRIGGRIVISVWAMEQKHRKFESQDVLVPWPKAYCISSTGSPVRPRGMSYDERQRGNNAHNYLLSKSANQRKANKNGKSYWIDPIFSPSPSTSSSLSSPNETCYSFFRRALQKLAGGRRNSRAWFLENWQNQQRRTHDDEDDADVDDLPIELRRLEEHSPLSNCKDNSSKRRPISQPQSSSSSSSVEARRLLRSQSSIASSKSKSLNSINEQTSTMQHQQSDQMVRSRSSIPGLCSASTSLDEQQVQASAVAVPSKPRLVHQKTHYRGDEDCDEEDEAGVYDNTAIHQLLQRLPDLQQEQPEQQASLKRGSVHKQSSMNEELMSIERLAERESVRRNIMKQASLNEELIYKSKPTLEAWRDSFYSASASKRFQLIKSGLTNRIRQSTNNIEKVSGMAIKNGFVRILQSWTTTEADATGTTNNGSSSNNDQCKTSQTSASNNLNQPTKHEVERRSSREDGSDSSKDSSLQSDTSVDSEDSFASVIFVPKKQSTSPLAEVMAATVAAAAAAAVVPGAAGVYHPLNTTSAPPSPRIKCAPELLLGTHRMKMMSMSPLLKQFPATSKSLPPPSPPGLSPRTLNCASMRPFFSGNEIAQPTSSANQPTVQPQLQANASLIERIAEVKRSFDCQPALPRMPSADSGHGSNGVASATHSQADPPEAKPVQQPSEEDRRMSLQRLQQTKSLKLEEQAEEEEEEDDDDDDDDEHMDLDEFDSDSDDEVERDAMDDEESSALIDEAIDEALEQLSEKSLSSSDSTGASSGSTTTTNTNNEEEESRCKRLDQIKELLKLKPGFATRSRAAFPIVRRASTATGRAETASKVLPRLLSLELFNPETDDLDSDSSGVSSPESVGSVISVISDERFTSRKDNNKKDEASPENVDDDVQLTAPIASKADVRPAALDTHISPVESTWSEECSRHLNDYTHRLNGTLVQTDAVTNLDKQTDRDIITSTRSSKSKQQINDNNPQKEEESNKCTKWLERSCSEESSEMGSMSECEPRNQKQRPCRLSGRGGKAMGIGQQRYAQNSIESSDIGESISESMESSSVSSSWATTRRFCSGSTASLATCSSLSTAGARLAAQARSASEEIPSSRARLQRQQRLQQRAARPSTASISQATLSGSSSQESLPSDQITYHQYYHVFREGELDQLIDKYVENLHIISSYYDHASWCVVAEKVQVWTI